MAEPAEPDVTRLLAALGAGDARVAEQLFPLIYDELHAIAARHMRHQPKDHTLQTTALVNEAYMRLVPQDDASWQDRAHYMCVAAKAMRCVLIDHARRKHSAKRGGEWNEARLDECGVLGTENQLNLLALDEALIEMAKSYPDEARVVELRFFGGLGVDQTARIMDVSTSTVKRNWRLAKAWLKRELSGSTDDGG